MHGTIVVLASTSSTTTTPATSTPTTAAPTTTTAAATATGPALPNTGFNVLAGLFAGLVLLGVGAGLRRARAR
jgi:LPXTG-motif cell wall-anchored protein